MPIGIIELDFPLIAPGQKLKAKVVFWQPINPLQIGEDIAGIGISFVIADIVVKAVLAPIWQKLLLSALG